MEGSGGLPLPPGVHRPAHRIASCSRAWSAQVLPSDVDETMQLLTMRHLAAQQQAGQAALPAAPAHRQEQQEAMPTLA